MISKVVNSHETITCAFEKLGTKMGISEANFSGKLTIENEDRVAGSKHNHVELEVTKDNLAMNAQTAVPFVDTNIIPDRNVGIGSLLRDLQNSQDPDWDGQPLLNPKFAFIDVGVSRARVSTTLKTLLTRDLGMDMDYVATERLEVVPYANVIPPVDRVEKIRGYLSAMISSGETKREITDWHYVVDREGKLSSVAYSYNHHGNEVWESYFMGRTFMVSGEKVEFLDPTLDKMLSYDVKKIETRIDLERKSDCDQSQPAPSWDGYTIVKNPLETGLAEFGIILQKTDIPQRIRGRQNVLYLGNVLNHYPQDEQSRELDRIAANMKEGDIIIIQVDELNACFIEVLNVKEHGAKKTHERVRWINTKNLEVRKLVRGPGSWREINLKPALERIVSRLIDCLGKKVISPEWNQKDQMLLIHQNINHVFATFFRALPVEETLRIAIREALRRLPSEGYPKGIPVFKDDAKDAFEGPLGSDTSPIVSEADLINFMLPPTNVEGTLAI